MIRPNRSMSGTGNLKFFLIMVSVSFGIAIPFALMGYWVVLPFAGLEMSALGIALYLSNSAARWCEVVRIDGDLVAVQSGTSQPERHFELNRYWTRVLLNKPRAKGHRSRLVLRAHATEVEVGACLNNKERERLAAALSRALAA